MAGETSGVGKEYIPLFRELIGLSEAARKDEVSAIRSEMSQLKKEIAEQTKRKKEEIIPDLKELQRLIFKARAKRTDLGGTLKAEDDFKAKDLELIYCDRAIKRARGEMQTDREKLKVFAALHRELWEAKDGLKKESTDVWVKEHGRVIADILCRKLRKEFTLYGTLYGGEWDNNEAEQLYNQLSRISDGKDFDPKLLRKALNLFSHKPEPSRNDHDGYDDRYLR